jgi:5-methylcytosine-specific restriction endonuclease McrA
MTPETGGSIITMQRVLVVNTHKQPLMPCHPARARKLLKSGKAAVYRRYPFTIILKDAVDEPEIQPGAIKLDPGSKTTGIAIVAQFGRGWVVLWAANLHHRGQAVKSEMDRRRAVRRSRRHRKTRYRQPRFNNRRRPGSSLAPSLKSRVDNVFHWARKLIGLSPVSRIEIETVRFDTHRLTNPEVEGVAYQQGELFGYEVREYLLEKWGRKCAYCRVENVPLEVEHIVPRSRGGTDRVSNLTLACRPCNQAKGNRDVNEFLSGQRLERILVQACQPLKDVAAVNAVRYAIGDRLKVLGLPLSFWSGGRTRFNRTRQGYEKDHWVDAACVGESGVMVTIPVGLRPLYIRATGRGSRQMCAVDKYGFPRTRPKAHKRVFGFQTGDMVKAIVPTGKKAGTHLGRVAIRSTGSFRVGTVDHINRKYCSLVQRADGYEYK